MKASVKEGIIVILVFGLLAVGLGTLIYTIYSQPYTDFKRTFGIADSWEDAQRHVVLAVVKKVLTEKMDKMTSVDQHRINLRNQASSMPVDTSEQRAAAKKIWDNYETVSKQELILGQELHAATKLAHDMDYLPDIEYTKGFKAIEYSYFPHDGDGGL